MSQGLQPRSSGSSDRQPPNRYRDLECVQLRTALPEYGLKTGEVGTIVHVFDAVTAYLVEFTNEDGSTRALAELTPPQIEPA